MNKQTINNYTEKTKKGNKKGFIDESSTYKTLPEKDELNIDTIIDAINCTIWIFENMLLDQIYDCSHKENKELLKYIISNLKTLVH